MAEEDLLSLIIKNVLDGRTTKDDRGLSKQLIGTPGACELIEEALGTGLGAQEIVKNALIVGMQEVGKLYEIGTYYLPDMLIASMTVTTAIKGLKEKLVEEGFKPKGKMVIATVEGDIHAIGKDMVALVLQGAGYEVIDLGVNVEVERIFEVVRDEKPDFLGLSALLTSAMVNMQRVVEMLVEAGIREHLSILIGGAPLSSKYAQDIGADFYGKDAFEALNLANAIIDRNGSSGEVLRLFSETEGDL